MAWAQHGDVTGAWIGDDAPSDTTKITLWLAKAEREVRFRVPDIDERIAAQAAESPANTQLLDLAKDVVVAMVMRVFRNPRGVRQVSTGTGPFTDSETVGGENPGALTLLDDELAKLTERPEGMFEIDLMGSDAPSWASGWPVLE